jgi:hypothetical protein
MSSRPRRWLGWLPAQPEFALGRESERHPRFETAMHPRRFLRAPPVTSNFVFWKNRIIDSWWSGGCGCAAPPPVRGVSDQRSSISPR